MAEGARGWAAARTPAPRRPDRRRCGHRYGDVRAVVGARIAGRRSPAAPPAPPLVTGIRASAAGRWRSSGRCRPGSDWWPSPSTTAPRHSGLRWCSRPWPSIGFRPPSSWSGRRSGGTPTSSVPGSPGTRWATTVGTHRDLAELDATEAYDDLRRSHDAIADVTGGAAAGCSARRTATWAGRCCTRRPGWTTDSCSGRCRWWSASSPATRPATPDGSWPTSDRERSCSGHDVGARRRLVALRGLTDMINGLRSRGYTFVTVSALLAAGIAPDRYR